MWLFIQDFMSPKLKHKKHWLSFTSGFFLHLPAVLQQLREHGKLSINRAQMNALLSGNLQCHRCKVLYKNMPTLKSHIAECKHEI